MLKARVRVTVVLHDMQKQLTFSFLTLELPRGVFFDTSNFDSQYLENYLTELNEILEFYLLHI